MKFAVLDIETTGLDPLTCRITEIGLVFLEDFEVKSVFTRLYDPGVAISPKITHLTGIDNRMTGEAGSFEDHAEELSEMLKDYILVGHRIHFDYSFLKQEMKRSGLSFARKTLCTAELAMHLQPGLRSYSLATLCRFFELINVRPHRALPDAEATTSLFLKLASGRGDLFLKSLFLAGNVPEHLKKTVYDELPLSPGVYYFIGRNNKPVYVGKAGNLRGRVLSHFRGDGNSIKILAAASGIRAIRFTETGSELLASLLEDHEIRHYWPPLNAAQKSFNRRFGVVYYTDQLNRWRMAVTRGGKQHCFEAQFHQYHEAIAFVNQKVNEYGLDAKLCGLPQGAETDIPSHNKNFREMMNRESGSARAEIFFCKGRKEDEKGFIWIEKKRYRGFGFLPASTENTPELIQPHLILRYSSITSENIIRELRESGSPALEFLCKIY